MVYREQQQRERGGEEVQEESIKREEWRGMMMSSRVRLILGLGDEGRKRVTPCRAASWSEQRAQAGE
jgi:hypothetical protein